MEEPSLESRVAAERARALALEARLAKRRAAEAAELELLESELAREAERQRALEAHVVSVDRRSAALAEKAQTLERGLSGALRSWVSLGEPVLGAVSLFGALAFVGLTRSPRITAALEGVSFLVGAAVTSLARAWRRRP